MRADQRAATAFAFDRTLACERMLDRGLGFVNDARLFTTTSTTTPVSNSALMLPRLSDYTAAMLIAFNKPFRVMCQFTDDARERTSSAAASASPRRTLAEFGLPKDVYAAGRLDFDSEGLLLLTDDGALAARLTDPRHATAKTYLVQVDGTPDTAQLDALRAGVVLNDGPTLPALVRSLDAPPAWLWPRDPPVRYRKTVPDAWIELTIREGRNRQVRRMTAAVGLPTLRLIRITIGDYGLNDLRPGAWRELSPPVVSRRLPRTITRRR